MYTTRILIKIKDELRTMSGVLKIHTETNDPEVIETLLIGKVTQAIRVKNVTVSSLVNYFSYRELFNLGAEGYDLVAEINLVKGTFKIH